MSSLADALSSEPRFESAMDLCVAALRRLAEYELDEAINDRMRVLGERKEFLDQHEHGELMSLVAFSERRTTERLEARVALQRLGEVLPDLVNGH
ncbi:MAG: hypothetical protein H8E44_19975 [Planctomycetes bacterium]|nr:hypothetical protein [Planctomycetota bacterium]MBL7037810.1 hypothetical protein [Pirellulaceae bacterium]